MNGFYVTNPIKVPLGRDVSEVKSRLAKFLGLREKEILSLELKKQSVDARDKSDVHFVCSYVAECGRIPVKNAQPYIRPQDLFAFPEQKPQSDGCASRLRGKSCIVVGGGPAGLFLSRYLLQSGVKVTVVERGSDVEKRRRSVKTYFNGGEFDSESNVQFGLGGAGTFSDGKLTTGISSPLVYTVFRQFVRCGAPSDIMTDAMPHIGTDNLVTVVANMRDEIIRLGGRFLFDAFVSDIVVQNGNAAGVTVRSSGGAEERIFADCVALCCGHSSRELFETLFNRGVEMQFKPFAVGLRVEHPREFINRTQYGEIFATHRDLRAATYKLANNTPTHGCYSFCMCPGGIVVPANSQEQTVVVNGMSDYARNAANSNSALVVTVTQKDVSDYGFGSGALSGIDFQLSLEKAAYVFGGGNYKAPYQNVTDFLNNKVSQTPDVRPSYPRGVAPANFRDILPGRICEILKQSLYVFDKKMKDFAKCGVLTGVETRTSSPVKIVRNSQTMQSSVCGLFPVGEGSGYSGGIVSSAVDGLKAAQKIEEYLKNFRK